MPERYPVPEYRYDMVIDPERRPESAMISSEQMIRATDLVQEEMESFFDGQIQTMAGNPLKITKTMEAAMADDIDLLQEGLPRELTGVERFIPEICWRMGAIFNNCIERQDLDIRFNEARKNRNEAALGGIAKETAQFNMEMAEWEGNVVKMLFLLENSQAGRKFLIFFWDKFFELGKIMLGERSVLPADLKKGILSLKGAVEVMENEGWEAYLPFSDQDAIQKIDLWAKRGNKVLATQIKTSKYDNLKGEVVKDSVTVMDAGKKVARELRQHNILLTVAQDYGKLFKSDQPDVEVLPYWLEVPHPCPSFDQDRVTGKVSLFEGETMNRFRQSLEEIGGYDERQIH